MPFFSLLMRKTGLVGDIFTATASLLTLSEAEGVPAGVGSPTTVDHQGMPARWPIPWAAPVITATGREEGNWLGVGVSDMNEPRAPNVDYSVAKADSWGPDWLPRTQTLDVDC